MKLPSKLVAASAILISLATPSLADNITTFPNGSRPSAKGPEAFFSGSVRIDPQFASKDSSLSAGW